MLHQTVHETSKRDQFLMKLRYDFEGIQSNLMHRNPVASLDACFNALLREEHCLLTQSIIEDHKSAIVTVAYVAKGKPRSHDMRTVPNNSANPTPVQQRAPDPAPTMTPEIVQQMIIYAFSALGFSGKSSSPWYFDSGTSNHMTNNA